MITLSIEAQKNMNSLWYLRNFAKISAVYKHPIKSHFLHKFTDERTDKVNYRLASLLIIDNTLKHEKQKKLIEPKLSEYMINLLTM